MKKLLLFCLGISSLSARDHKVDIAATLMSAPQVFCKDTQEEAVQMGHFMNLGEVLAKSLSIAQEDMDNIQTKEKIKLATYGLAAIYNLYIMTNPEEIVRLSQENKEIYKKAKHLQQAQWLLEIALRAAAFYVQQIEKQNLADLGVEAADLVGISRMISRHYPDLMANAPAYPKNVADQQPLEKREIILNEPITTSTEVQEVSKLALLKNESDDASLKNNHDASLKNKKDRRIHKKLRKPIKPIENPHKKPRTLEERLAEAEAYTKYKNDLAEYYKAKQQNDA